MTLNERSYLLNILEKYSDRKDLWDLTDRITDAQRKRFLALYFNHKTDELKEMLENVIAFQSIITN